MTTKNLDRRFHDVPQGQTRVAIWAESLVGPHNGTARLIEELVKRLISDREHAYRVTLICPSWGDPYALEKRFTAAQDVISVTQVRGQLWPLRFGWLLGWGSLTKSVGYHDVWFSGHIWPLGAKDVPFVGILHDLRLLEAKNSTHLPSARQVIWKMLTRIAVSSCLHRAAIVTAVSQTTRQRLFELIKNVPVEIDYVPNGVNAAEWSALPLTEAQRMLFSRLGLDDSCKFILAVGSLTPHKNFATLARAFEGLARADPESHLLIAGADDVPGAEQVREAVTQSPVGDRIRVIGRVSDGELRILMKKARAFASPSTYEGFGIPLLEAMAAGTPIIASNIPAHNEVASHAALLVDPLDLEAWRIGLINIWQDQALRSSLSVKGLSRATFYNWDSTWEGYKSIIARAMHRQKCK